MVTTPERPSRVDEAITPKTADALTVVMTFEGVDRAEALRRIVSYGELVFRTVRLEGGEVLLRHGDDIERIVLLDPQGEPIVRDLLVWMRPSRSKIGCAFPGDAVAAGSNPLTSIAQCGRWPVADLVQDNNAERCPACRRAAQWWRGGRR